MIQDDDFNNNHGIGAGKATHIEGPTDECGNRIDYYGNREYLAGTNIKNPHFNEQYSRGPDLNQNYGHSNVSNQPDTGMGAVILLGFIVVCILGYLGLQAINGALGYLYNIFGSGTIDLLIYCPIIIILSFIISLIICRRNKVKGLLTLTIGLILCLGLIVYYLPALTITQYSVSIEPDFSMSETFEYSVNVDGKVHSLNRVFDLMDVKFPSDMRGSDFMQNISLISISAPPGSVAYVKNCLQKVSLFENKGNPDIEAVINSKARTSEVGAYRDPSYPKGKYSLTITTKIHPIVEYSGTSYLNYFLNLNLGKKHEPYQNVKITIPSKGVRVYPYPSSLVSNKNGDAYVITGYVNRDESFGIELIMDPVVAQRISGTFMEKDDGYYAMLGVKSPHYTLGSFQNNW